MRFRGLGFGVEGFKIGVQGLFAVKVLMMFGASCVSLAAYASFDLIRLSVEALHVHSVFDLNPKP